MSEEDLFKPLYKSHRRILYEDLRDVFDPQGPENSVRICGYTMNKESKTKWSSESLPGLELITGSLSLPEQAQLIGESLDDFLVSEEHLNNLDAHYSIPRPINMFDKESAPSSRLPTGALVRDKLRWITLGGQYNWTTKKYPSYEPGTPGCPHFPESLSKEVSKEFGMNAEAAIVNYYSEGNILSPHQDITELTNQNLVSISIGCTCIFYICKERYGMQPLPILLRSGDIVVMGGSSRFAFHGVGRIFGKSTPSELCSNPAIKDDSFADWMLNHRININVRQMK